MSTITIPVTVGADRHLEINLPEDVPIVPADLIIRPRVETASNSEREAIRAKLLAAGMLVTEPITDDFYNEVIDDDDDSWEELGILPPGARSSDELIDEDRGLY